MKLKKSSIPKVLFSYNFSNNTDHRTATLDTHHGLGPIATANGEFTSASFKRQKILRDKRQAWKDVKRWYQNYPIHHFKCCLVNESILKSSCIGIHKHLIQCPRNDTYQQKTKFPSKKQLDF